jgi:hypothetical protein
MMLPNKVSALAMLGVIFGNLDKAKLGLSDDLY